MIRIFTPSFADEANTNAQNLSAREIVCRLSPERFHVTLLYESDPDPRIVARNNTRLLRWHRRGNTLRILATLFRERPDIYFFPREGPLDTAFISLRRSQFLGIFRKTKLVTYVVSGGFYNPDPVRATLARNILEADAVVGNCIYLSALVQQRLNVLASTIYDGIDRRYFFSEGRTAVSTSPPVVLFAGSFRPYKRASLLVGLAATRPQIKFRFAGIGEEEPLCRELVSKLGCSNVEFLGHLSSALLGEEMRRSSVLFHPSVLEGHPQVFGQAAACGLPIVALNLYRPDYVVHDQTGLLAFSDAELEQMLDQLLASPAIRQSMSRNAVEHAKQFEWDRITQIWEQTFLAVAQTQTRSG